MITEIVRQLDLSGLTIKLMRPASDLCDAGDGFITMIDHGDVLIECNDGSTLDDAKAVAQAAFSDASREVVILRMNHGKFELKSSRWGTDDWMDAA